MLKFLCTIILQKNKNKYLPSASVCLSIKWVLVMFSLVREMRDCCANQQCNASVEK